MAYSSTYRVTCNNNITNSNHSSKPVNFIWHRDLSALLTQANQLGLQTVGTEIKMTGEKNAIKLLASGDLSIGAGTEFCVLRTRDIKNGIGTTASYGCEK